MIFNQWLLKQSRSLRFICLVQMKVLVVHRQSAVTESIREQLPRWVVTRAHTGLEGLLATRLERFDLILSSFDLPVVTGIEMVRSLRFLSINKNVPVVMLAEGDETPEHTRLVCKLNANLLTLDEVHEMESMEVEY